MGNLAHEGALRRVGAPGAAQHQDQALGAALLQAVHQPRQRGGRVGRVDHAPKRLDLVDNLAAARDDLGCLDALDDGLHRTARGSGLSV